MNDGETLAPSEVGQPPVKDPSSIGMCDSNYCAKAHDSLGVSSSQGPVHSQATAQAPLRRRRSRASKSERDDWNDAGYSHDSLDRQGHSSRLETVPSDRVMAPDNGAGHSGSHSGTVSVTVQLPLNMRVSLHAHPASPRDARPTDRQDGSSSSHEPPSHSVSRSSPPIPSADAARTSPGHQVHMTVADANQTLKPSSEAATASGSESAPHPEQPGPSVAGHIMPIRNTNTPDPSPADTSHSPALHRSIPRTDPEQTSPSSSSDSARAGEPGLHMHELGSGVSPDHHQARGGMPLPGRMPELNETAASFTTDPRAASNDALSLSGSMAHHHGEHEEVGKQGARGEDRTVPPLEAAAAPANITGPSQQGSNAPAPSATPTPRLSLPLNASTAQRLSATPSPTAAPTVRTARSPKSIPSPGAPGPPSISPAAAKAAEKTTPHRRRPDKPPPPGDALSMISPARATLRSAGADLPSLNTELPPPTKDDSDSVTPPATTAAALSTSAEPVLGAGGDTGRETAADTHRSYAGQLPPRSPKPRLAPVQHRRSPNPGSVSSVSSGTPLSGRQLAPLPDVGRRHGLSARSHSPPRSETLTPKAEDATRPSLTADSHSAAAAPGIPRIPQSSRSKVPPLGGAPPDGLLLRPGQGGDRPARSLGASTHLQQLGSSASAGLLEEQPIRGALKSDKSSGSGSTSPRRRSTGTTRNRRGSGRWGGFGDVGAVRFVPSIGKLQDQDSSTLDRLATRALGVRLGDRAMLERWQEARAELEQERERVRMLRCMAAGRADGQPGVPAQALKLSPRTILVLEDELIQKEHQEKRQHRERIQQKRRARSLGIQRSTSAPSSARRVSWVDPTSAGTDAGHPGQKAESPQATSPSARKRHHSQPAVSFSSYSIRAAGGQQSAAEAGSAAITGTDENGVKWDSPGGRQHSGQGTSTASYAQGGSSSGQAKPRIPKLKLTQGKGGQSEGSNGSGSASPRQGAPRPHKGGGKSTRRFGMSPRMQLDTLEFPIVDLCGPNEIVYLRRLGRYLVDTTGHVLKELTVSRNSLGTLRGLNALHQRMSVFIPSATRASAVAPSAYTGCGSAQERDSAVEDNDPEASGDKEHGLHPTATQGRAFRMSTFEADDVESGQTPWCCCGRSIVHLSPTEIAMPQQFLLVWAVLFYYAELVLAAILIGAFLNYGETLATVVTCCCVFAFPAYRALRWLWLPIHFSRAAKAAVKREKAARLKELEQTQGLLNGAENGAASPTGSQLPEMLAKVRLASAKSTARLVGASTQRALMSILLLEVLVVAYKLWREAAWDRLVMYIVPAPLPVQLSETERRAAVGERVAHHVMREQASIHLNQAGDFNSMHERLRQRDALLQQLKATRLSDAAYRRRLSRFKTYASLATMRYHLLYSQTFPLMCIVLYSMLFHQFNSAASTFQEFTDDSHETSLFWVAIGFTMLSGIFSHVTWRLQYRYRNPLTADVLERSENEPLSPATARFEPLHQSQMVIGGKAPRHARKHSAKVAAAGGITLAQREHDTIGSSRGGLSEGPRGSVARMSSSRCCCCFRSRQAAGRGQRSVAPRSEDDSELRLKPLDRARSGINEQPAADRSAPLRVDVLQPENGSLSARQQPSTNALPETPTRAEPASVGTQRSSGRVHSARSLRLVGNMLAGGGFTATKTSSTVMPLMAQGFTSGLGADIHAPVSPGHVQKFFMVMSCCELAMRATTGVALSLAFGFWALCFALLAFVGNFLIIAWAGHLYPAKAGSCIRRPQLSGMTVDSWTFVLAAKNAWLGFVAPQELPVSPSEFLHASGALNLKRRMSMNRMSRSPTLQTIAAAASQVVVTRRRRFRALWAWQLSLSIVLLLIPLLIPSELLGSQDSRTLMSFVCTPDDPTCPNSFPFWFAVAGIVAWMGTCATALYFLKSLMDSPDDGCGLHKILVRVQPLVSEDAFIIQQFIRMHPGSVYERDRFGNTALHVCVMTDFTDTQEVVQWLMYAYPEAASMPNMFGDTPLHLIFKRHAYPNHPSVVMTTYLHLKYINDHFKTYKTRLARESLSNAPLRMRLADKQSEYGTVGVLTSPSSPANTGRRPDNADSEFDEEAVPMPISPVHMGDIQQRVGTPGSVAMHQSAASAGTLSMLDIGLASTRGPTSGGGQNGTARPAATPVVREEAEEGATQRRGSDTSPRRGDAKLQISARIHSTSLSSLPPVSQHSSPTCGDRLYDQPEMPSGASSTPAANGTPGAAASAARSPSTSQVSRSDPLHPTNSFSIKAKRPKRVSTLQQLLATDLSDDENDELTSKPRTDGVSDDVQDLRKGANNNGGDHDDDDDAAEGGGGLVVKLRRFRELHLPPLSVAHIIYNATLHMLSLNPSAATVPDQFYEIPLHLALRVSNAPSSVIYALLDAYPLGWLIPNKDGLRLLTELISYEHQGGDAVAHALDARDVLNEFQLRDLQRYLTDITKSKKSRVDAVTLAVAVFGRRRAKWNQSARNINLLSAISRSPRNDSSHKSPRLEHQAEFREKRHASPLARIGILADTLHRRHGGTKSEEQDTKRSTQRTGRGPTSPLQKEVTTPKRDTRRSGDGAVSPHTPVAATAAAQPDQAAESPV